ncbi:protein of unknown function [Nitrospira defluvii]|uniref:Uncharacterized protein n=1 Tax=Nitrospira defluvii TaxID=330214 RepID=D8P8V7_9BACT|nr:protein of unknown function [Nitrospira defluvii]
MVLRPSVCPYGWQIPVTLAATATRLKYADFFERRAAVVSIAVSFHGHDATPTLSLRAIFAELPPECSLDQSCGDVGESAHRSKPS